MLYYVWKILVPRAGLTAAAQVAGKERHWSMTRIMHDEAKPSIEQDAPPYMADVPDHLHGTSIADVNSKRLFEKKNLFPTP
jgi:hypothetical protein